MKRGVFGAGQLMGVCATCIIMMLSDKQKFKGVFSRSLREPLLQ